MTKKQMVPPRYSPKTLNDFWKYRVNTWLIENIRVCIKNHVNIGSITLICCYIDFLGSLLKPNADSRKRFYICLQKYFKPINYRYDFWKCKVYEDFRCGLVHEAVMKKETGIFRQDEKGANNYQHLQEKNSILWIDLIQFFKDFKYVVQKIKKDLDSKPSMKKIALSRLRALGWALKK